MPKYDSDELALLSRIHANPRDDAARLVYADWLQEHNQPEYAEFIRLQIGQAAGVLNPWESPPESDREHELLKRFRGKWGAPFLASQAENPAYDRGLPSFQVPRQSAPGLCFRRGRPANFRGRMPPNLRARCAQALRYGSPRHSLTLVLGTRDLDSFEQVKTTALMERVHSIVISSWEFQIGPKHGISTFIPLINSVSTYRAVSRLEWVDVATDPREYPELFELLRSRFASSVAVPDPDWSLMPNE